MESFFKTVELKWIRIPLTGLFIGLSIILVDIGSLIGKAPVIKDLDSLGLIIAFGFGVSFIIGTGRQITNKELELIQSDNCFADFLPFLEEKIKKNRNITLLTCVLAFNKYKKSLIIQNKNSVDLFLDKVLSPESNEKNESVDTNVSNIAYKERLCKDNFKEVLNHLCRYSLVMEERFETNSIDEVKNILYYAFPRGIIEKEMPDEFKNYGYIKQYFDKHDKRDNSKN